MHYLAIKIGGDWQLDVNAIPFDVVDSDGQWFDARTRLWDEHFPTPPVVYYHGYGPDGVPQGDPEVIGKIVSREKRADGVWVRVVLDKTKELAKRIWEAAQRGLAAASSGSIGHLARLDEQPYRKDKPGRITSWAFAELSLIDIGDGRAPANRYAVAVPVLKSVYEQAGMALPDVDDVQNQQATEVAANAGVKSKQGVIKMDKENEKVVVGLTPEEVQAQIAAALKAAEEARAAEAAKRAEEEKRINEEVEKRLAEYKAEAAKNRRLPFDGNAPHVTKYHGINKYDNLSAEDTVFLAGLLQAAKAGGQSRYGVSENALKAAIIKADEQKTETNAGILDAVKSAGIAVKADEVMQQDLTSYGDEWVGIAYSQALWEAIRVETFVAQQLSRNAVEVPQGIESMYLPLEGADPTFYKVAETTDHNATTGFPNASVPASKMGTGRVQLTLSKLGARVAWSGELEEDSLIPFVAQLRRQLVQAGAEYLESAIIDGHTATAATTNINDIANAGTQAGTEYYLLFNGFRANALVTNTANSRSASGSLTVDDFLATMQLMGSAGINALDRNKVGFIIDPNTHYAALKLTEVKTRDKFSGATVEGGTLTNIWGYPVYVSGSMHKMSATRKANSAGKIDRNTPANNAYGAILAVRWDQWVLGYKRRMTMEITRYPRSDSSEIVLLTRVGLVNRDTEASAITYNVGV